MIKESIEEMNNRIGKNTYDRIINVIKIVVLMISLWITFDKFMGYDSLVNSHPYYIWLLSGFIPALYIFDVLYRMINDKKTSYKVINMSSFMIFSILTFLEIVLFRISGFSIDIYYIQIPIYMMLSYIFLELCGFVINNLSEKIKKAIGIIIVPLFLFSGIFYNIKDVKYSYLKLELKVNPINYLINGFRNIFVNKRWIFEGPERFICFVCICLLLMITGFITKKNKFTKK